MLHIHLTICLWVVLYICPPPPPLPLHSLSSSSSVHRKNRSRATSLEVGSELYRKVLKPLDRVSQWVEQPTNNCCHAVFTCARNIYISCYISQFWPKLIVCSVCIKLPCLVVCGYFTTPAMVIFLTIWNL